MCETYIFNGNSSFYLTWIFFSFLIRHLFLIASFFGFISNWPLLWSAFKFNSHLISYLSFFFQFGFFSHSFICSIFILLLMFFFAAVALSWVEIGKTDLSRTKTPLNFRFCVDFQIKFLMRNKLEFVYYCTRTEPKR